MRFFENVGDFFGEVALMPSGNNRRTATIRAGVNGASCLVLGRKAFDLLAGGATEILEKRQESYQAAVKIQSKWRGVQARRLAQEMWQELTDPQVKHAMEQRIVRLVSVESGDHSPEEDAAEQSCQRRMMIVLDFAGQRMYYIMHHILMSPRMSAYAVCINLAADPDAQTDGDEGSSVPMTVCVTVLMLFLYCFCAVLCGFMVFLY